MTDPRASAPAAGVEKLLRRLEAARAAMMESLKDCEPSLFRAEAADGESLKRWLERTADDVNLYYGRLAARALTLAQPPCIQKADFSSLREATVSLQVAHRRFSNLLHDLSSEDLKREAVDPELGTYTMRQILEMAAAHYDRRAQQINSARAGHSETAPE
jgi:hypothetical protein